MLKKSLLLMACLPLLTCAAATAEVNINVNIGAPVAVPIIVPEPPLFLVPPSLGFRVAVGLDIDLFHIDGHYYACRDNVWYIGPRYNGPWTVIVHDRLPSGLRQHRLADLRSWRDDEYRHYRRDEDHYRGRTFRPGSDREGQHGHGKNKGTEEARLIPDPFSIRRNRARADDSGGPYCFRSSRAGETWISPEGWLKRISCRQAAAYIHSRRPGILLSLAPACAYRCRHPGKGERKRRPAERTIFSWHHLW